MYPWMAKFNLMVLIVALAIMMSLGGFASVHMMSDEGMHDCPFMGIVALCEMSPLQHLSQWQLMFATSMQQLATISLLLLLALTIAWRAAGMLMLLRPKTAFVQRQKKRERVFDALRIAFARGIIHPKVF